jgi:hypothetical protein
MSKKSAENTLLSKALFEQGYSALATLNCANEILEKFSVKEDSVSKALAMMIRTHSKLQGTPEAQTWNIENFSKAILQKVRQKKKILFYNNKKKHN